jgi:hypothetical protein
VETADYERGQDAHFARLQTPTLRDSGFFRIRRLGQPHVYVIGDSISTRAGWPSVFAQKSGRRVFSQAIGGTRSPSMVSRAQGVELASRVARTAEDGSTVIGLRWHPYNEWRLTQESYRTIWAEIAKTISDPESVEVYVDGVWHGLAQKSTKSFSTDHANHPRRITSAAHGLAEGDRVDFTGGDPAWPVDLDVTDSNLQWRFTSGNLPPAIVERRAYFVAASEDDSFEIREFADDTETLNLGGDASPDARIECGWAASVPAASPESVIGWKVRTKYDDWIWLLCVSANDIPGHPVATYTIPNIDLLIGQMRVIEPKYLIITPPISSAPHRGVGSFNWTNYHDSYLPLVHERYGNRVVDTQELMNPLRTEKELSFLDDPATPQLLWIAGDPILPETWQASPVTFEGASQQWVGPGFTPLQFRARFNDPIHLGSLGNSLIGEKVDEVLRQKNW